MTTQKRTLRLYVAGISLQSGAAIANLRSICEQHYQKNVDFEIIDVFEQPDEAEINNIIAVPTLIKSLPLPLRRLIGDMNDKEKVILVLDA